MRILPFPPVASLLFFAACMVPTAKADVEIFNPHWSMIVDDYGYSDMALDQRPGFEGREYLSGEWAGAISYTQDGVPGYPLWLNPEFIYPDWISNSDFGTETYGRRVGVNQYGFDIFRSVIANSSVRISITSEMIDTTNGIPQGLAPATGPNGSNVMSDRYVFRQTFSITNTSGQTLDDLKVFRFLHSLQASRAIYDDRNYGNTHNGHRYTISEQSPPDDVPSPGDLVHHDTISLHANIAPTGWEVGHYGIENIDSHALGRPSVGVHLSVEADALSGLDFFAPENLWVSGAMRFNLGNLAPDASTNVEFLMSLQTVTIAQPPFRVGATFAVKPWGKISVGQTNVPPNVTNVLAIAAGENHSLALLNNRTVVAWGDGSAGQTNVPAGLSDVWDIAAGGDHSLAVDYFGDVIAWGDNSFGQTNVPPNLVSVEAVAAGGKHCLALQYDGTVAAWGDDSLHQTDVPDNLADVWEIAAGGNHSLALNYSGNVIAWGDNSFGQTDIPNELNYVEKVAAGKNHSLALRYDGTVVAWGENTSGQTNVPGGLTGVVDIAAGTDFSLALKGDGTIVGWGNNSSGQTNVPNGLNRVLAIAAGGQHCLARHAVPMRVSLSMARLGTNSVIGWPASFSSNTYLDAVIEGANSIDSTNWTTQTMQSLVEEGFYTIPVPVSTTNRFFRLRFTE